ncbi:MAG: hypothetical protein IPM81_20320 [Saprospirales bacterium]|nr:hypothetical protein [Saprospirales bacterium]
MKNRLNALQRPNFYFWQDKNNNEIDLITDEVTRQELSEIKAEDDFSRIFQTLFKIYAPCSNPGFALLGSLWRRPEPDSI